MTDPVSCSPRLAAALAPLLGACASPDAGRGPADASEHAAPPAPAAREAAGPYGAAQPGAPQPCAEPALTVRDIQTGVASWYGEPFHGRLTASGEVFDKTALTAAHPSWPLRSLARVTRIETGESVLVRVNDRGPFVDGRIIDLSRAAAEALGFIEAGLAEVRAENLGPADPADRAARSRIPPRR